MTAAYSGVSNLFCCYLPVYMMLPILKLSERIRTEKPVKNIQPCDNTNAVLPETGIKAAQLTSGRENSVDIAVLNPPILPMGQSIALPLKVMSVMLIIPVVI